MHTSYYTKYQSKLTTLRVEFAFSFIRGNMSSTLYNCAKGLPLPLTPNDLQAHSVLKVHSPIGKECPSFRV